MGGMGDSLGDALAESVHVAPVSTTLTKKRPRLGAATAAVVPTGAADPATKRQGSG